MVSMYSDWLNFVEDWSYLVLVVQTVQRDGELFVLLLNFPHFRRESEKQNFKILLFCISQCPKQARQVQPNTKRKSEKF